jgi:hypothetical protein
MHAAVGVPPNIQFLPNVSDIFSVCISMSYSIEPAF